MKQLKQMYCKLIDTHWTATYVITTVVLVALIVGVHCVLK